MDDVEAVYKGDLLGIKGQIYLEHYQERLKTVLGDEGYGTALSLLTEAAVNDGLLTHEVVKAHHTAVTSSLANEAISIPNLLHLLQHDGYLESCDEGYRFVSGLLQDWWLARHGQLFTPIAER